MRDQTYEQYREKVSDDYYKDQALQKYKEFTLEQLENASEQVYLSGSNGRGQTATVPLIILNVIDELIKERKENG